MPAVLAILGIMNGLKSMQAGNRIGGISSILGSAYSAGWFNGSSPSYDNTLGDFGVKRNYL